MIRQAEVERSAVVAERWPLLRQAVRLAGHPQTRSRGTIGGSVAHADPAAELPVALLALDAVFHPALGGGREVRGRERLLPRPAQHRARTGELLVEIEVPALPVGARTAFVEHARTHGDFATAGAAVVRGTDGTVAIAVLGIGGRPTRIDAAELATACAGDDYRWALVAELVSRALSEAS